MKKDKKHAKKEKESNVLILDDVLNSNDPEVKQFLKCVIAEEMGKASLGITDGDIEAMEQAVADATERATVRVAWRFKDKLSPQMQRLLEEQHPDQAVA